MNMTWTFSQSSRMYEELNLYADKMGQVGLFHFTVNIDGSINGSLPTKVIPIINKWPKVKWFLTIQNYNTLTSIVQSLLDNQEAQDKFINEIDRLLNLYPYTNGIDIDLEKCGGQENQIKMKMLIERIYNFVHSKGKLLNICFPPITGPNNSVGGEYWCAYEDYTDIVDTAAIMSYGFAWLGSAPGPVSPKNWLDQICIYAKKCFSDDKILIGLGAWCIHWALHKKYNGYNAESGTYYYALNWMLGEYDYSSFKESSGEIGRQPHIPFVGYWDDLAKICYVMPHIYDYIDANHIKNSSPLVQGIYQNKPYVTSYTKYQNVNGIECKERTIKNIKGAVVYDDEKTYIATREPTKLPQDDPTLPDVYEEEGSWEYFINIDETNTYDICLELNMPWFNKNGISVYIDEIQYNLIENKPYNITNRIKHIYKITRVNLSKGQHIIKCTSCNGIQGAVCYGVLWGKNIKLKLDAGNGIYQGYVRPFKDKNKNDVTPVDGYSITFEVLRRTPDSANIWYDDWRDYKEYRTPLSSYYEVEGNWTTKNIETDPEFEPRLNLFGSGQLTLKNCTFSSGENFVRISSNTGRVGPTYGDYWACYNFNNKQIQLYEGENLLFAIAKDLGNSNVAISIRVRPNSIRVYSGTNKTLAFKRTGTFSNIGYPGVKSDSYCQISLLRFGDGWAYEPYECLTFNIDNNEYKLGRIQRTNVEWDDYLNVFKVTQDIDEKETRDESISMDYTFEYTGRLNYIKENKPISFYYQPEDINVWLARTYIGDADGYGIMFYEDADVLSYWNNRAKHHYNILGTCMWTLGQEDSRLWNILPKCI